MSELKPCPFCGGTAHLTEGMGEFWVLCRSCGASSMTAINEEQAIILWNPRAEPSGNSGGLSRRDAFAAAGFEVRP
jgi:Lar family restriction alleviation protein